MSEKLTKEKIIDVISKSKTTTISGIWKYLGHSSAISGGQGKKIRELVPNYLQLLEANKKGTLVTAEKTAEKTEAPVTVPVQPAVATVTPAAEPGVPKKAVKKEDKPKGAGGFRANTGYAILFAEGSKGFADPDELIKRVAKIKGKEERLVRYDLETVMYYPSHPSNRGRADVEEKDGKIKIIVPSK